MRLRLLLRYPSVRLVICLLAVIATLELAPADGIEALSSAQIYQQHVQPLLTEKCVSCHGPLAQEAGLRLDAGILIRQAAEESELIRSNDPDASTLLRRVRHVEESERMPPPGEGSALRDKEIAWLRQWIASGAESPADESFLDSPQDHWAFQPIVRPVVPTRESLRDLMVGDGRDAEEDWSFDSMEVSHPIDAFLWHARIKRGVRPLPVADRETQLRRLTFGLTGLPPDQHQRALAQSDMPMIQIVDSLLASPEYAERWARHWMDVWRYSDWDGFKQQLRGSQRHIWHWRDWILESLAADKPYDEMILEMLAADEAKPLDESALRATGFLARNYHHSNRDIWLDATVEHTAKAFLGLTMDCAKCHDHKYDPISQEEYYRFRAIFEPHKTRTLFVRGQPNRTLDGIPVAYDAEPDAKTSFLIAGDEKRPDESKQIAPQTPSLLGVDLHVKPVALPLAGSPQLRDGVRQMLEAIEQAKVDRAQAACHASPASELMPAKLAAARAALASFSARFEADTAKHDGSPPEVVHQKGLAATEMQLAHRLAENQALVAQTRSDWLVAKETLEAYRKASQEKRTQAPEHEQQELQQQLDDAADALQKAEQACSTVEKALARHTQDDKVDYESIVEDAPRTSTGRRLALARWMVDEANPLTARIAVNHLWLRHFGKPLVDNVFDFGLRSPRPQHHALLDYLAVELRQHGWRMKPLHRLIVTSQVYALASSGEPHQESALLRRDPSNETYWRFDPLRLEAEAIRDSLLEIGGQLDRTLGGPDIDHQQGETVPRRSLYFRHAYEKQMTMLTTFDAASPTECYRRDSSIIPQQALVLANSELARRMSEACAQRLHDAVLTADQPVHTTSDQLQQETRIQAAFETVLGRLPRADEQAACAQFLQHSTNPQDPDSPGNAWASLIHVLVNHNDFVTVR